MERTVVPSGEPVVVEVTQWTTTGWSLPAAHPGAAELTTTALGRVGPSIVGGRSRTVVTYELSGEDGSYVVVVPPVEASGPSDQTRQIEPSPVFVDIGKAPPKLDGLVNAESIPAESDAWPTWMVASAVGLGLGVLGLLAALGYARRTKPPPPPKPAEVVAREAWAAARSDDLDDHGLALALSQIFRRYLQAVTGFPMLTRTTREIVRFLNQEALLNEALRPRTLRVLDATDRLKFAREGGGSGFFDALEADFLAVVDALSIPAPEGEDDA
ncbi:MAG: hypothetical protein CL927_01075 [Deltaproteobacteria bacterium]|nr:hypothetical protein [Deltaproteobacteria bacterium]HCH63301.1 hypothetical protein [Deltaproteobacteria bacterium]